MQQFTQIKNYDEDYLFDEELDNVVDMDLDWNEAIEEPKIPIDIHIDSISDGLIYSLRNLGKVDIEYISKICDTDMKTVIKKLRRTGAREA